MHNYHHHHHHPPDLLSRTNSQNQDLRLSLQPFPDGPPSLLHHHHPVAEPVLFYGQSNPLGYDGSTGGWEQQSIQRLVAWNSGGGNDTGNGGGGLVFAPPPNHPTSTTSFQPVNSLPVFAYQHGFRVKKRSSTTVSPTNRPLLLAIDNNILLFQGLSSLSGHGSCFVIHWLETRQGKDEGVEKEEQLDNVL
ncbi:Uncharacterized protein Rs2_24775 [Raphanus sativus]|nr:Uncharacterized protein Rs2_24775 [Raphanus sativus]